MYRLVCPCGQEMTVRGSQAGCQVTCDCGMVSRVPALSELKVHQERNEATPAFGLSSIVSGDETKDATSLEPRFHFYHCCGMVGQDGTVSSLAMNHYVELVQLQVWKTIRSTDLAPFAELVLSIALAPGDKKWIEFDLYPEDANLEQQEILRSSIRGIEAPPIYDAPIAFAFYVSLHPPEDTPRSVSTFSSLSDSIKSVGMEAAIREALGMTPKSETAKDSTGTQPKRAPWWRRLLFGRKQQSSMIQAIPTAREHFIAQEQFMQRCEAQAKAHSWIDLKRALVDAPDEFQYRVAFAEKHRQHQAWAVAIEWYDGLIRRFEDFVPLLGRRAALYRCVGNSQAALIDYSRAIERAPHEASFRFQRSFIYGELQAWDEATRDLDEALRLTPFDPEILFYRALVRLQLNKPTQAVDDFFEATRLDPNFGQAHFRLGWLYSCLSTDRGTVAIEHLSRAVALSHDNHDIRLHRSLAYLAQNKVALAMEDCQNVLDIEPDNALAHGICGRILQSEGQFEEAIVACTRSIELGHEHTLVYLARAISYASTDQSTLAAVDCDSALALEPNNAWVIQLQGHLKLQTGDLDAAMNAFHRVRELSPDWVEPREQISLLHRMKENPRMSVEEQTLLIERHPKQASHYVNRAFAFTQLHEFTEAANDYDRAIELDPENDRLYYLRGIFRMNCQLIELALADFERVMTITGGDDSARSYRASLLIRLNRFQEAIDDYTQLIAQHPEDPHPYSGRAFAWTALGNTNRANEDSQRAIEMSTELADAIHRSTEAANIYRLIRTEDYDSALDAANKIVSDYPDESIGYRLRAHVYWEREEYVESREDYTRVIEMDGSTPDCHSSRGQVQAELGEWDLALADLDQAVEMARGAGQTIVLAYALNGRSLTLAGLDRNEESSRDFEESVRLCPTNPWVYYHRGMREFHLNRPAEAKMFLELALEFSDPPLSKRKKQRARIVLEKVLSGSQLERNIKGADIQ